MKLRVWWVPQIPMTSFKAEVRTVAEGKRLLMTLAEYDLFQFTHNVKPDYCNAGGLQVWEEVSGDWIDWEHEDGRSIDECDEGEVCHL